MNFPECKFARTPLQCRGAVLSIWERWLLPARLGIREARSVQVLPLPHAPTTTMQNIPRVYTFYNTSVVLGSSIRLPSYQEVTLLLVKARSTNNISTTECGLVEEAGSGCQCWLYVNTASLDYQWIQNLKFYSE